ncbi:hypothetical protein DSM100688_1873 [Bifidobacterium ramosum]|uniref:Uncharacterized protein n=1 Tax=Bifidobacterium ramosum TaxID=1798158 RepID=A0A6L4X0R2_9BIFI|nr:hypothetical protein DSM100688_1873 [Bifidobacterium ramosum]
MFLLLHRNLQLSKALFTCKVSFGVPCTEPLPDNLSSPDTAKTFPNDRSWSLSGNIVALIAFIASHLHDLIVLTNLAKYNALVPPYDFTVITHTDWERHIQAKDFITHDTANSSSYSV